MSKSHSINLSALLLPAASLFFCVATTVAQEAPPSPEPQHTTTAINSDAPDVASQNAATGETNAPGGEQRADLRFAFEASRSRVADIGRIASERPLFAPAGFDRQGDQNKPASPQPTRTPLTGEEKMKYAAKRAFLSPEGYATTLLGAAITEYTEDDLPHKTNEDRFADFASRFAIRFTTRATNTLLGQGVFPILFKQDPRYRPADKGKNVFKRAAHAASRVFVTDDDDGNLEPNYSRWAGALSSSAIANLYEQSTPGRDRIGADATLRRFGSSFTSGMVNNIIREFLPDIIGIFKK